MSQIVQIQISFNAAEDRLLLRFRTDSNDEFRFWLTRRYVRALKPALQQMLHNNVQTTRAVSPEVAPEVVQFEHQQVLTDGDFKTPFKAEDTSKPLGETPLVLTRFQMQPRDNNSSLLKLAPEQGPAVDLTLPQALVHSLLALLDNALKTAEWDLAPSAIPAAIPAAPASLN